MRDGLGQHQAFQTICADIQMGNTGRPVSDLARTSDLEVDDWLPTDNDAQHGAGGFIGPVGGCGSEWSTHIVGVHGFANLRAVDTSGNPGESGATLMIIMICEKVAAAVAT